MKYALKTIFAIAAFTLITLAAGAQPLNFSGSWKRNNEKTDPGELSINSVPVALDITQTKNDISIKRTSKNKLDSTFVYTEILKFDGSVSTSTPKSGVSKTAMVKWATSPDALLLTADYADAQGAKTQSMKETWTLEDAGKTLKIISVITTADANYTLTQIFDRQ